MRTIRLKSATVGDLIDALKKFPRNAGVAWQDHDSNSGEISSHISNVAEFKPDGSQDKRWTNGISVIIYP